MTIAKIILYIKEYPLYTEQFLIPQYKDLLFNERYQLRELAVLQKIHEIKQMYYKQINKYPFEIYLQFKSQLNAHNI